MDQSYQSDQPRRDGTGRDGTRQDTDMESHQHLGGTMELIWAMPVVALRASPLMAVVCVSVVLFQRKG